MTHAGILPINVDAVYALVFDKLGNICGEGVSVGNDGLPHNVISSGIGRVRPTTKRCNTLDACEIFKASPLIFRIYDFGFPSGGVDLEEGPVDMRITAIRIGVLRLQQETVSFEVVRLIISNALEVRRRPRVL